MKESTRTGRIVKWMLGIVFAILFGIYVAGVIYYGNRFFPETKINKISYKNMLSADVMKQLEAQFQHYTLEVCGRNLQTGEATKLFEITASDIDLCAVIAKSDMDVLLKRQNHFLWPVLIWQEYDYYMQSDVSYDSDKLMKILDNQEAFRDECTTLPIDAYIKEYSEETGNFEIEPEVLGTRLNTELAKEVICTALVQGAETVHLEELGCYLEPTLFASDEALQQSVSDAGKWLETEITYDWNNQPVILNKEQIKNWIVLEDNVLTLNQESVSDFVEANAAEYDTFGKYRTFRTTLGYDLMLPSGAFGWLTDCEAEAEALLELIKAGTVGSREPIYASKAPWKGVNDIGNSYVEADMTHQHLYLYQKGVLVLETDFVSGDMSKSYNTPEGVFGITYKTTNAVLRGGDYAENVSYWMPYHGNYGMHDATWREEFGGDIFMTNGSHGCLNLPLDKAGEIYQQVSEGFPVICYYYPPGVLPEATVYDSEDEDD